MSETNTINTRIKLKRDEESDWDLQNPTILNGELVLVDCDDGRLRAKIGDGESTYSALGFIDHIHVITEDNKEDPIPANAILVIDTTEDDLTGSIIGGGNNSGGADGCSLTVDVTPITGGYIVKINEHSFNIMDGVNGKDFTYEDFTTEQLAVLKGEIIDELLATLNGNEVSY